MKKIFLTSGIIVCMACPAFADFDANLYNHEPGEQPELTQTGACEQDHLGVTSGSTILKAIWTANDGTISFNNDISWTNSCSSDSSISHNDATGPKYTNALNQEVSLANLYTRYGIGTYPTSTDKDNDTNGMSSLISPSRAGYRFDGYYTHGTNPETNQPVQTKYVDADGSFITSGGVALLDTLIETANGTETLYAHWTPKTYTIAYNCGVLAELDSENQPVAVRRESGAEDTTVTYDNCYSLDSIAHQCGTTPTGYTFGGWQCIKTTTHAEGDPTTEAFVLPGANSFKTLPVAGQTTGYPDGISAASLYAETTTTAGGVWNVDLAANETVTCTAIWRANSIDVIWTSDGTTSYTTGTPTPSCTYDGDVKLPTKPERTGYTFGGWEVQAVPTAQECQAADNALLGC